MLSKQCSAVRSNGQRCKKSPKDGMEKCAIHSKETSSTTNPIHKSPKRVKNSAEHSYIDSTTPTLDDFTIRKRETKKRPKKKAPESYISPTRPHKTRTDPGELITMARIEKRGLPRRRLSPLNDDNEQN